uniref:tRNA pseudouridine(55) synthase n=1 Tax=Romanomermis culicivorax TaxID=13658 RepID=A0A915HKG2_ROMCU
MKFSRYVHQTPWVIDGEKRSKNSVQEIINQHFSTDILCDETKFTASGREDADVRMLGNGRPFALQFLNPRRKLDLNLNDYVSKINFANQDVRVDRLKVVSQKDFDVLNKSEDSKIKNYVALCYSCHGKFGSEFKLPEMKFLSKIEFPLEITQKTPIRVLHRRPLIDRKRKIYRMDIFPVDDVHFQLRIATEAGTYIKEFVHGDFGRTRPSLGDLLGYKVDILELDVEKVDFDWP